jgi:hypothetical protein
MQVPCPKKAVQRLRAVHISNRGKFCARVQSLMQLGVLCAKCAAQCHTFASWCASGAKAAECSRCTLRLCVLHSSINQGTLPHKLTERGLQSQPNALQVCKCCEVALWHTKRQCTFCMAWLIMQGFEGPSVQQCNWLRTFEGQLGPCWRLSLGEGMPLSPPSVKAMMQLGLPQAFVWLVLAVASLPMPDESPLDAVEFFCGKAALSRGLQLAGLRGRPQSEQET